LINSVPYNSHAHTISTISNVDIRDFCKNPLPDAQVSSLRPGRLRYSRMILTKMLSSTPSMSAVPTGLRMVCLLC
jgi:hypothetical protein